MSNTARWLTAGILRELLSGVEDDTPVCFYVKEVECIGTMVTGSPVIMQHRDDPETWQYVKTDHPFSEYYDGLQDVSTLFTINLYE